MIINRRGFIGGLISVLAAPAIVHAGNLMPVKIMLPALDEHIVLTKFYLRVAEEPSPRLILVDPAKMRIYQEILRDGGWPPPLGAVTICPT